jgi:hypothetical protein
LRIKIYFTRDKSIKKALKDIKSQDRIIVGKSAGGFSALGFRQRLPDCPLLPDFAKRIGRCEPWLHATAWRNTLLMFSFSYFN